MSGDVEDWTKNIVAECIQTAQGRRHEWKEMVSTSVVADYQE